MASARKNDVGVVFRVTFVKDDDEPWDISTATVKQIIFRKPSAAVVTKAADFTEDGSDGQAEYTSEAGDLDEVGNWKIEGYAEVGGQELHTEIGSFSVGGILE